MPNVLRPSGKRAHILRTAQQLFRQHGYAQTSMDMVTAKAGVSKQTVYAHFPGKDQLFFEVMREYLAKGAGGIASAMVDVDTPAALERRLCEVATQLLRALLDPDYLATVRMAIAEMPRIPQLGDLFSQAVPRLVLTQVSDLLTQAAARGLVVIPDPILAARLFVGPFVVTTLLEGLLKSTTRPKKLSKAQTSQLVRLFLTGVQPGAMR